MKHTTIFAALFAVVAMAGTAHAGGVPGSIGVGAELSLSGAGGLSANYDAGKFHAGGFLGFFDPAGPDNTTVDIGGRFFFHIAQTASSDFSLGGSLGLRSQGNGPNDRLTEIFIEPSFQIRVFIVPNVALSFTGGIEIGAADASEVNIGSNTSGTISGEAGVHYYF